MRTGLLWVFIEKFGASLLSVGVFFIYARLLTTEEMGQAIIILSITQFLALLLNTYFEDALVQKKELSDTDISTHFWASTLLATLFMFLTMVGVFLWENNNVTSDTILPLASFAVLEILLTNLATTYVAELRRKGQFKILALRVILGRVIGAFIGLACIFSHLGAWSIVAQSVGSMAFQFATLLFATRKIPAFEFKLDSLKESAKFGFVMSLRRLSWDALVRLTPIVSGIIGGASLAGIVGFAWRIVELPRSAISSGLSGYFLPVLARDQHNREKMAADFLRITSITTYLTAPLFLGIYIVTPYLIGGIFDEKWHDTIPLIQIFSIAGFINTVRSPATITMNAAGHPEKMLMADTLGSITAMALMFAFGQYGAWAIGLAYLSYTLLILPRSIIVIKELLGLTATQQFTPITLHAFPTHIMFIVLFAGCVLLNTLNIQPILSLFLLIAAGGIIFLGTSFFIHKQIIKNWIHEWKTT